MYRRVLRGDTVLAVMLAHGVKLVLDEADVTRAYEAAPPSNRSFMFGYGPVMNYLDFAYHPVETAMTNHDDLVHLLVPLGASVNVILRNILRTHPNAANKPTLKDWIENAINNLSDRIDSYPWAKASAAPLMNVAECSGWQKFYREYHEFLETPVGKEALRQALQKAEREERAVNFEMLEDAKGYLVEVKKVLDDHGAKTWKEVKSIDVNSTATCTPDLTVSLPWEVASSSPSKVVESRFYVSLTSSYNCGGTIPQHLSGSYDELYEACYVGDNEKIQSLCLPTAGAKSGSILLNISVMMTFYTNGYTPLFAAVVARRWSTAKLILAIAAAQYHPEHDDDEMEFNVDWDDHSDNESCDSDVTVEKKEAKFIDIATRSSVIKTDIHPKMMITKSVAMWRKGERTGQADLLSKAVIDHDLEAFVNIANLYQTLPDGIEMEQIVMDTILKEDQPEILDEYIRRTGAGVDMKSNRKDSGDVEGITAVNDKNKVYLGLKVHGKKRADLARANDPSSKDRFETPILWKAVQAKAKAIVEYLAGDRPLTAYRFYASTHSNEQAIWLRRTTDLDKLLPTWLGWVMSNTGDSPLMAGIIADDVDIIKLLFQKAPQMMAVTLHQKIKFIGFNALTFAVYRLCDLKLIDYLLARSVCPAERDLIRGWNIYHIICEQNNGDFLEYFLRKLPRDVSEALLAQQSNERRNTPLHIAVKLGRMRLVKLIVEFTKSTILMLDADGQTTLHAAVQSGYPNVTRILLAASDPKSLQIENSVGNTLFDIASLGQLGARIQRFSINQGDAWLSPSMTELLTNYNVNSFRRYSETYIQQLEKELPKLHATLDKLLADGRLKSETKLTTELTKFASMMGERLSAAKIAEAARPPKEEVVSENKEDPQDTSDVEKTLSIVVAALKGLTVNRQPAHLVDVQKSVGSDLDKAGNFTRPLRNLRRPRDKYGLEAEKDEDEEESQTRRLSMVWKYIEISPDI